MNNLDVRGVLGVGLDKRTFGLAGINEHLQSLRNQAGVPELLDNRHWVFSFGFGKDVLLDSLQGSDVAPDVMASDHEGFVWLEAPVFLMEVPWALDIEVTWVVKVGCSY
jgi:hypothetical protein